MFGAVHIIYCIISSIATKVDSTYLGYETTAHNVYVFGDRCARTIDIEITSPTLTRHRHTSRHHQLWIGIWLVTIKCVQQKMKRD